MNNNLPKGRRESTPLSHYFLSNNLKPNLPYFHTTTKKKNEKDNRLDTILSESYQK
jgi:hypothetical protein